MNERMTIEEYKACRKNPIRHAPNKRGDKAKGKIGWILVVFAKEHALNVETEYRFNPERKWRADWAITGYVNGRDVKIIIEYEGVFSDKSRHTTLRGYTGDTDKYRSAAILGWTVLRYTAKNYGSLTEDLKKIINQ